MATSPKAPVAMCVVNIGFHAELLLPASQGMKLVELLQQSRLVSRNYLGGGRDQYLVADVPEVTYQSVKASQLVLRDAASAPASQPVPRGPKLLGRG